MKNLAPSSQLSSPERRQFLGSSLVAGAWILGSSSLPLIATAQEAKKIAAPFEFWLRFTPDGQVTAFTTVTNLGQGTHATIAQMVAEELALPLSKIVIQHAPVIKQFHQQWPPGITTFASAGTDSAWRTVAPACAAAREMLVTAAATRWQVAVTECSVSGGQVLHATSARTLAYVDLLADAASLTPPAKPKLTPVKNWKVLGLSTPRADIPARVDGSAVFGIDVQMKGLLYAAVMHAPRFGETLAALNAKPALSIKGVRKVVRLPNAVAVVADSFWTAQKAVKLLKPEWNSSAIPNNIARLDTEAMRSRLLEATAKGEGLKLENPRTQDSVATDLALGKAAHLIDLTFEAPFLAHAAMEPLNATVEVTARGAQVWVSTQSQTDTQRGIAQALGFQVDQVTLHTQNVGGGFGRRLEQDFAVEAALIAKDIDAPVKTIWSRENDMQAGYYRPMTSARVRLALDEQYMPLALRHDIASPSLLAYTKVTNSPPDKGYDWTATMGINGCSYHFPKYDTRWTHVDFGVPCTYWRSVGNSQNCHFLEHSLEMAARAAGLDSITYRKKLLAKNPLALAFVTTFASRANWDAPVPMGHYRGFAMNGTVDQLFSAHIVEIQVVAPGQFRLVKIVAAIDPGVAANPKGVEAQLMGGTIFGLSAALFGEMTFKDGQVEQTNFDTYRLTTMAIMPPMEVMVLANGKRMQGVGEEGPPSIIAALANALLAAGGKPITRLPVKHSGWQLVEA